MNPKVGTPVLDRWSSHVSAKRRRIVSDAVCSSIVSSRALGNDRVPEGSFRGGRLRIESADRPCFICELVAGANPHPVVYRDDFAIAFLNRYPTLPGYVLVAPLEHKEDVVADFDEAAYLRPQSLVYRVGRAVSSVLRTERLYVLSLGSKQGNAHVHWHVAPLPPGVPYEKQQFRAAAVPIGVGYQVGRGQTTSPVGRRTLLA